MRISDWSSDVCSSDLVDGVVHELKGDTKVAPIGVERHFLSIGAFSNDRCTTAGRCEESSRLCANDLQIMLFVRVIAALVSELIDLFLLDPGRCVGQVAQNLRSEERRVGTEWVRPGRSSWWTSQ